MARAPRSIDFARRRRILDAAMSDPPAPAPPRDVASSVPSPKRAARPARWLDRLSVLLLVAASAAVIAVATPAILRAAGLELVLRADPRAVASVSPHRAPPPVARPPAPPVDDAPRLTELERLYPDGMWPGQQGARDTREEPAATNPKSGHTLSPITLREHADPSAKVVGQVPAGVRLMMVRESGEWVMVVFQGPDGLLVGWAKRDALTNL
jgi:Bacterial SH3 domain